MLCVSRTEPQASKLCELGSSYLRSHRVLSVLAMRTPRVQAVFFLLGYFHKTYKSGYHQLIPKNHWFLGDLTWWKPSYIYIYIYMDGIPYGKPDLYHTELYVAILQKHAFAGWTAEGGWWSPNSMFLGVEMIDPVLGRTKSCIPGFSWGLARTIETHQNLANLGQIIASVWGLDCSWLMSGYRWEQLASNEDSMLAMQRGG